MNTNDIPIQNIVAYFDFDGTLTSMDTLLPFLLYTVGWKRFIAKLYITLPIVFKYFLKFMNNEKAKELVITALLSGVAEEFIQNKAKNFASEKIALYIKPEILSRLEYHLEHKHKIILVSANLAIYLRYWAFSHNIDEVIATEIEFVDGKCTGKLATRNCYGPNKISRINEYLRNFARKFSYSYGYGNSKGDYELLNYVDEGYWVHGTNITPWDENNRN